jgi:hypothetical protein
VAGSGYVIRDSTISSNKGGNILHDSIEAPFISKLLAFREGMEDVVRLILAQVILQIYKLFLVSLWQDEQVRAERAPILNELKVLSQNFRIVGV